MVARTDNGDHPPVRAVSGTGLLQRRGNVCAAEAKLIPIITTASEVDAVKLAQTYTHRWPAHENSLRDYLLAVGLDTNHGYTKLRVENSEVSKRRAKLEQRLANLHRWAEGAGVRGRQRRT